jgi:RHS repeat-associated protein
MFLFAAPDRLGSIGRYLPYGEERTGQSGNPANGNEKFATYTRDGVTGLDYADQRWYAQGQGRFLTSDPYQASGGPTDPASWNRYAYVQGDPVNYADPSGLARMECNFTRAGCSASDWEAASWDMSGVGGPSGCAMSWTGSPDLANCYVPPALAPEPISPYPFVCDITVFEQGILLNGAPFVHTSIRLRVGVRVGNTIQWLNVLHIDGVPDPHQIGPILAFESELTIAIGDHPYYSSTDLHQIGGSIGGSQVCDDVDRISSSADSHRKTGWTYYPTPGPAAEQRRVANSNSVVYTLTQVTTFIPVNSDERFRPGWGIRLW